MFQWYRAGHVPALPAPVTLPNTQVCILCADAVRLDDAQCPTPAGRCVCLRCWMREVGQPERLSVWLEAAVRAALAGITDPLAVHWLTQ